MNFSMHIMIIYTVSVTEIVHSIQTVSVPGSKGENRRVKSCVNIWE